jgi:hypothetical protein
MSNTTARQSYLGISHLVPLLVRDGAVDVVEQLLQGGGLAGRC